MMIWTCVFTRDGRGYVPLDTEVLKQVYHSYATELYEVVAVTEILLTYGRDVPASKAMLKNIRFIKYSKMYLDRPLKMKTKNWFSRQIIA